MSLLIVCPKCERKLRIPDTAVGKNVKCPACASIFKADALTPAASAAPSAPVQVFTPPAIKQTAGNGESPKGNRSDKKSMAPLRPEVKRKKSNELLETDSIELDEAQPQENNLMLDLDTYLVRQRTRLLKLSAAVYDIFDPQTNQQVGVAREEPSMLVRVLRLLINKKILPTKVVVHAEGGDEPLFSIHRGMTLLRSKVDVKDGEGKKIGSFKSKMMSLGGGFWVYDAEDQQFAEVKGDWKGWNFKFITADGEELGSVGKKWAGLAKEMFTSADNYVIGLTDAAKGKANSNELLLAAGLAIDIIYKE